MAEKLTIHIDFDKILDALRRSVRRADVLMGVGVNAAEHQPPISHILSLDASFQIQLVKENLSDPEKAHTAEEFGKWVRANGLRELLEGFSLFLLELYSATFLILRQHGKNGDLRRCPPPRFERLGIGDQMEQLSHAVAVDPASIRIIRSLNQARNCYAHRRGLVGAPDVQSTGQAFTLEWTAFQLEVQEPDGNIVQEDELFGRVLENGGMLRLRLVKRERSFVTGQELVVEKRDLKEICLCLFNIGQQLFNEAVAIAKDAGILKSKIDSAVDDPKPI